MENENNQLKTENVTKIKQGQQSSNSEIYVYNCETCDRSFRNKKGLNVHKRVHEANIPQLDGLDVSFSNSSVNESESSSLARLMSLTEGLNSFTQFGWKLELGVCLVSPLIKPFFVPSVNIVFTGCVRK